MLLGVVADDFTGASDVGNMLTKNGMATTLFVGVPQDALPTDSAAGVVALKTRSGPAAEAVSQSLAALAWLQAQGCRQFLFKYCSTFDSTPEGNIGPVAEALLNATGAKRAIVCPAFPGAGRSVYMGHLFVGDRLLNESGLEKHPLTPMTDADIRRWLSRQCRMQVGWCGHAAVSGGTDALRNSLDGESAKARSLIVVDALNDSDLRTIGEAVADDVLVTGGSGIAIGLAANFAKAGELAGQRSVRRPITGAACVLSGSCSSTTNRQVAAYSRNAPVLQLSPRRIVNDMDDAVGTAVSFASSRRNTAPLISTTADAAEVATVQRDMGRERVAYAIERFFGAVAVVLAAADFRRIVVGGGETSGAVVGALNIHRLDVGPEIAVGVPALYGDRNGQIGLVLKSGNFGSDNFYAEALEALARG